MKKQLIIFILAGMISFGASFGVTWFFKSKEQPIEDLISETQKESDLFPPMPATASASTSLSRNMTEKQLRTLISDIREKMNEYRRKENELKINEQRLEATRELLQKDIEQLDALRVQLATTLSELKQQEQNLNKRLLEITANETANIQRIASQYDKMDVTQASKIMINMATNSQANDAVKILYYMSERTAGKLLGEIGSSQPDLASMLTQQLKKVKEST